MAGMFLLSEAMDGAGAYGRRGGGPSARQRTAMRNLNDLPRGLY